MSADELVEVEIGYEIVHITKMYGPLIFAELKIQADLATCEWVIHRQGGVVWDENGNHESDIWEEWVRIPGQMEGDFNEPTERKEAR